MPPLADALLGPQWGLAGLVVIACIGLALLISGHFHKEDGETETRLKRRGRFVFLGCVIALAIIGVPWAVKRGAQLGAESKKEPPKSDDEHFDETALLSRYPLGYEIFYLDYSNQRIPYRAKAVLDKFFIDWSVVRYVENEPNHIRIRLPNVRERDGTKGFGYADLVTGGFKKVGRLPGFQLSDTLVISAEILAVRENGIVFVIGFSEPKH